MKQLMLILLTTPIGYKVYSQCNIPYGEKIFTQFETRQVSNNPTQEGRLISSVYTDIKVQIALVTRGNESKSMFAITLPTTEVLPTFIVSRKCETASNGNTLYILNTNDGGYNSSNITYLLTTDRSGKFIRLAFTLDDSKEYYLLK